MKAAGKDVILSIGSESATPVNEEMLNGRRLFSTTSPSNAILLSFLISAYLISYIVLLSKNIDTPYLWYDEAGQFWIAKGLNHDSDPLQEPGSIMDVVTNNALYNMDPGGFSILLHLWTALSNTHTWLRLLPALFMFMTGGTIIALAFLWTGDSIIAVTMGFIPLLYRNFVSMGFEIRAYSMEYLGVVVGIFSVFALSKILTRRRLLLAGCILGLFMTSRYAIAIVFFFIGIYVIFMVIRTWSNTLDRILSIVVYALPQVVLFSYSYFFALRIQNPYLEEIGYLPYLSDNWRRLVSPAEHAVYLLVILAIAFILCFNRRIFQGVFHKYMPLLFVTVCSNIGFIFLSFAGSYPWNPFLRGGQVYLILTLLCVTMVMGELVMFIFRRLSKVVTAAVLLCALALSLFLARDNFTARQIYSNKDTFIPCMETIDFSAFDRIYVDRLESPKIRYLFEYGDLAGKWEDTYPGHFTFAKGQPHNQFLSDDHKAINQELPYMNDLMDFDLLMTTELYKRDQNDNWVALNDCGDSVFVPRSK